MLSTSSPLPPLLSLALAISVGATALGTPASAATRQATGTRPHAIARAAVRQLAPASVLGLDGDDTKASMQLTDALRAAFKERGLSGGEELSLVEMRLTMGCENLEPACMAEGGAALSVDTLIYGHLQPQGEGSFQLDLQLLDVGTSEIVNQTSEPITAADLAPDVIGARALAIVDTLLGQEEDPAFVDEPATPVETSDPTGPTQLDKEPRQSQYWFGRDKGGPVWKTAGLGVGAGLAVTGLAVGLIFGIPARRSSEGEGFLESDIIDAADASQSGPNPIASVGQGTLAICEEARARPVAGMSGVYNSKVGNLCLKGERYAVAGTVGLVVMGVGIVSAATFGALLLVHKKSGPGAQALRRHQLRLGVAPARGGASFGSSFRF